MGLALQIHDWLVSMVEQDVVIRETQIMHDQRHYNVLPLYCSFVNRDCLWLVMPFVSGGSLETVLRASFAEVTLRSPAGSHLLAACAALPHRSAEMQDLSSQPAV